MTKVLLLAGTGEARRLAALMAQAGVDGVASLAGATDAPAQLALTARVGGFGGAEGFRAYIKAEKITAVVDATHPFARRITDRTAALCAEDGVPYLHLLRPGWTADPGDDWHWMDAPAEADALLPEGATVLLATGRQTAADFGPLRGRRVILRVIDPPRAPLAFEQGEFVIGRPPFTIASEREVFRALGVDWIVAKDAGGSGGRAKLDAAWSLGLPVAMIRRPHPPKARRVETPQAALDWIMAL